MAYFPDSIMPARIKDDSEDVRDNPYVVSAGDVNKHDEEIRAIESVLGIRDPNFPVSGFSGMGSDGVTGFSSFSSFGSDYYGYSSCGATNVTNGLQNILTQLQSMAAGMVLCSSGTVMVAGHAGATGLIPFPVQWPITWLIDPMPDDSPLKDDDESTVLPDIAALAVNDVSNMPDVGYVSIINDVETASNMTGWAEAYTSLASDGDPIFRQEVNLQYTAASNNSYRMLGLGTNVEIVKYYGVDSVNNRLLNVRRRQAGTTSTRHSTGDMVFKGKLSIHVAPVLYVMNNGVNVQYGMSLECSLRSDGRIELKTRRFGSDNGYFEDSTMFAYANYQATLIRSAPLLPDFNILAGCPQ